MRYQKITDNDAKKLREWWRWLDEHRGDRAQLRRATVAEDALLTPAFKQFLSSMPECWRDGATGAGVKLSLVDMAMIASVLARVKSEPDKRDQSFAYSLASPKKESTKACMSELRFQQLQKSRTADEFFTRICRAINLLGGKANVASLADDICHWLIEYQYGPASKPLDRLAVRWATDYYLAFKD